MKKRTFIVALCLALVVAFAAGGAVAWLTDKTETIENTFTVGKVKIDLAETKEDFKMIPGMEIEKDPIVTVKGGSEDCWLFVKVEKANDLDTYITYTMGDGWTELTAGSGVYYREVAAAATDTSFSVLKDNKVAVKDTVTSADMLAAETAAPKLSFTAYAIQQAGISSAADAWAKVSAPAS